MEKVTVLAIAADSSFREWLGMLVEEEAGLAAIVVEDVAEAIRATAERKPSLILLDWPEWPHKREAEGPALVSALAGHPHTRGVPIITLAYQADAGREALKAGCADWIAKTAGIDHYLAKMKAVIGNVA